MIYIVLITFLIVWFSLWFKFMDNQQSYLFKEIDKVGVYLISLIVIFMVFFVINGFELDFIPEKNTINGEEKLRSAYGALGDYFGGILNPIFGLLGLFILLWTLRITRDEMRETKKALDNQEKELLLTRLSETFTKQCEGLNRHLDSLSVSFSGNSAVFANRQATGTDVIHDLSMILFEIADNSQDRHPYGVSIRDFVLLPNSRKINNYSEALCSSLNMFIKTIALYEKDLGNKEKEQLFIIVEAILNYETTYYFMHVLHEANRFSSTTGMLFPYSRKLSLAKKLMEELNEICRPSNMIDGSVTLQLPFEVQEWGRPDMQVDDL